MTDTPKAELDYDHQHGWIVRVRVGNTIVAVYLNGETGIVTTPDGHYGLDVSGPWFELRKWLEGNLK